MSLRSLVAIGIGFWLLSAQASAELRIGVAVAQYDSYIAYLVRAIQDRAVDVPGGAKLNIEDAGGDVVRQIGQVENFISHGVDALIVNPADTGATAKITERAVAAGIPLVYLNSRPEVEAFPKGVVFVGTDERAIGEIQMRALAEQMGGKGNLAILLGRLAHDDTRKRTDGVKRVLADYPDIHVVQEQSGDWQRDQGMTLMSNWLLSGQDIDAVAANNDEMGIGAAMALRQSGSDILVAGIDGTPDGLVAIGRKQLALTVFRDPVAMGHQALDAAIGLTQGKALAGDIWINVSLVTSENIQQYQR